MTIAIFDIGSGSVGVALARLTRGAPPLVLYATRVAIPFQRKVEGHRLESLMREALGEAALALLHNGLRAGGLAAHARVDEIFVSLSAPWTTSRITTLHLRSATPVRVTEELLARLRAPARSEETTPRGSEQIEEKLFHMRFEGRESRPSFGHVARFAEFSLFQSFAPSGLAERIEETILHHIHAPFASFHSFSLLAFAGVTELLPEVRDYLLVDVSGEQTEVCIVKDQTLERLITIPFGRRHLIRALCARGLEAGFGESFLSLHTDGCGEGRHFEEALTLLHSALREWSESARATLAGESILPREVCLLADADARPLFAQAIEEGALHGDRGLANIPLLEVSASTIHADPFLALLTLSASTLRAG